LVLSPQGDTIQDARIALGAVAPIPIRVPQAEAVLTGKPPTQDLVEEAAERSVEAVQPISDIRGSAEYRIKLAKVLTRRTLVRACKDLGIEI